MPYNIIADLGEYTTNYNVSNKCNLFTVDNEIMLCDDIELTNYIEDSLILTLSNSDMAPDNTILIPCGLSIIKKLIKIT